MRYFFLHDESGRGGKYRAFSGECVLPDIEGMIWTEVPSMEHKVRKEGGKYIPIVPEDIKDQKERAKIAARSAAKKARDRLIRQELARIVLQDDDAKEKSQEIDEECAARESAIEDCSTCEDVRRLMREMGI